MYSRLLFATMLAAILTAPFAQAFAVKASPEADGKDLGMALLGAMVDYDGTLLSDFSSGVVSSRRVSVGKYHVTFDRSLLGCTPVVGALGATRLAHLSSGPDSATWEVLTRDPTGHFADSQFSLINLCTR